MRRSRPIERAILSARIDIKALLDSNVLIAAIVADHQHHASSLAILEPATPGTFAVPAHALSEAYSNLTRRGPGMPGHSPAEALAGLEKLCAPFSLIGLTPAQTADTIRSFAQAGGIGPRLYDQLIGESAVIHDIPVIITWNVRHFEPLFPDLQILTPEGYAARSR